MLLEAELFGYEKGAFTGASDSGKAGLFELANQGTIFLDEIGDLPFSVQAKLLKCLDDGEIRRLGGTEAIKVNCIVIAATNHNLEELLEFERKKLKQALSKVDSTRDLADYLGISQSTVVRKLKKHGLSLE
jgi:transcriptional regulator with PAS, ATPase and Fis domain